MREEIRGQLDKEITRKQFLQYVTGAMLMVLGLNNLVSLLTGGRSDHRYTLPSTASPNTASGFGSRRFGR